MKNMNRIIGFFLLMIFSYSCSGMSDAAKVLKNEKIRNTDEFLVKKRQPLVLPPNYEEIPAPGSIRKSNKSNKNTIDKILKAKDVKKNNKNTTSSVEQSIINKITK